MNKISLCIVDDHPVFLAGLTSILSQEKDFKLVGTADNGRKAVELIMSKKPEIVVMDIEMPFMNGFEVAMELRKNECSSNIIFLTMYDDPVLVKKAQQLGVMGFILKENAIKEIITCVRTVHVGNSYINTMAINKLATVKISEESKKPESSSLVLLKSLTDKEREIMLYIGEGHSTKEIANKLFISGKTVQNHRSNICKKLEITGSHSLNRFILENKHRF